MSEREHIRKSARSPRKRQADQQSSDRASSAAERGDQIKAELDDLLDEIDEVLEANAEDFIKSYVQKGGQ